MPVKVLRAGDRLRSNTTAGDGLGFIHSLIHSSPQPTLMEGPLSARLYSQHWNPAMSKTDKMIPALKELYLTGCSTRGSREREKEQKQIKHASS